MFSTHTVICPIWYGREIFKNVWRLYIGPMWVIEAMKVTPGGPDTHNDPHKREAVPMAAWPLFILTNHFRNYQKLLNFWFIKISPSLYSLKYQLFSEKNFTWWVFFNFLLTVCSLKNAKHFIMSPLLYSCEYHSEVIIIFHLLSVFIF